MPQKNKLNNKIMEKYYLIYDPSDNEGIFITTNLELAEKECEESGVNYIELPFHI